jgi:hypothetical protein
LRDDDEGFTNPKPMDDGEPASAIACTPDDALALVFVDALTNEEKHAVPQIEETPMSQITQIGD